MENENKTLLLCKRAKDTVKALNGISDEKINAALLSMAEELVLASDAILTANSIDVSNAKGKISDVMIDRLRLTPERIKGMADGIREITRLPSPLGITLERTERPNGLIIEKRSVPMGVIAIIYESRPNVTSDAAALALKSGNVCILKSGKEAYNSALAIVKAMQNGLSEAGLPESAVNLVEDTTREGANTLMRASGYVDLLIPRGGAGLIRACVENATVPCLETGTGICHVYVDRAANIDMALDIIENAKTSRPSVCNAIESLLVHKSIAQELSRELLPKFKQKGVRVYATPYLMEMLCAQREANEEDFATEFLDYAISVREVESVDEAIEHIARYSTKHSECIVTEDKETAELFTTCVDASSVYVNASTRFTDGFEFGFGAEIGISTQKLHARGPMGLKEITSYKYVIEGNGQVR